MAHHDYPFTVGTSLTNQQRNPEAESFLANWENWWQQIDGTQNRDPQTCDSRKPILGMIVRNGQNSSIASPENILCDNGPNEGQGCDHTHEIVKPIDRFMADNNDIGGLYAQTLGVSPRELLILQLDRLGLTESSSPPSEKRHDKDRNRRLTQKAECSNVGSKPEQRLEDQRRRRKQNETKKRIMRTLGARRYPLVPIDLANP